MKRLFVLFAISLPLILGGCSNTEQDISPLSPQVDKGAQRIYYPYKIHQTFPELAGAEVVWENAAKGLLISVKLSTEIRFPNQLFGVINFVDRDRAGNSAQMVFLGEASQRSYLISGINDRIVGSVKIYYLVNYNEDILPFPYAAFQLFSAIGVKAWKSTENMVKVSSEKFHVRLNHLFAEVNSDEGNNLIFLGKPYSEVFTFPKSVKQNVTNVRLFGYMDLAGNIHSITSEK
jgi:hypothetical protein